METFLNEHSLGGQYSEIGHFTAALKAVNRVLARVSELPVEKRVYCYRGVYHRATVGQILFSASLASVRDKSVRILFKVLLERLGATDWLDDRLHEDCAYLWGGRDVRDSTLAEHAERRLRERIGFLLSFEDGGFAQGRTVVVTKAGTSVNLDSVHDELGLTDWKRRHPELGLVTYDDQAVDPPPDHQTVLSRKSRFHRTRLVNQGRAVYLDRTTFLYWCVDNLHSGAGAHIEVFDAHGDHVGEAGLDGTMIPDTRDATKKLPL